MSSYLASATQSKNKDLNCFLLKEAESSNSTVRKYRIPAGYQVLLLAGD